MALHRFEIEKFTGENDFGMWRIKMKALLVHQGLSEAISREGLAEITDRVKAREIQLKAHSAILLSLGDEVLREVADEDSAVEVWEKLQSLFLKRSLTNRLFLKKQLYTLHMEDANDLRKHMDDFNKIILDLKNVEVKIEEEDQAILLLSSLLKTYEHIVDTLLYGKQTLTMTEVKSVLMFKEVQRRAEIKDEKVGDILMARGRSESKWNKGSKDSRSKSRSKYKVSRKCFHCHKEGHYKKDCPERKWQSHKTSADVREAKAAVAPSSDGYESSDVLVVSAKSANDDWIIDSGCSFHMTPNET